MRRRFSFCTRFLFSLLWGWAQILWILVVWEHNSPIRGAFNCFWKFLPYFPVTCWFAVFYWYCNIVVWLVIIWFIIVRLVYIRYRGAIQLLVASLVVRALLYQIFTIICGAVQKNSARFSFIRTYLRSFHWVVCRFIHRASIRLERNLSIESSLLFALELWCRSLLKHIVCVSFRFDLLLVEYLSRPCHFLLKIWSKNVFSVNLILIENNSTLLALINFFVEFSLQFLDISGIFKWGQWTSYCS